MKASVDRTAILGTLLSLVMIWLPAVVAYRVVAFAERMRIPRHLSLAATRR